MADPKIGYILPSFRYFEYSRRCLRSLFAHTPHAVAIIVDDASPGWHTKWLHGVGGEVHIKRFPRNGGLTRSWNEGFRMARNIGKLDYLIAGNNDVVMFEDWWRGMVGVLDKFALTGPLSNAPGVTAGGRQQIERYVDKYQLTDDAGKNNPMSHELWLKYGKRAVRSNVNGFFMMAKMDTWYDAAFDGQNVFRPMNYRTFSGKKNNTPGMTGNEDELQSRWRKKGLRSAIALGSFVFHFRSVARGKKFAKSGWTRMEDLNYGL